MKVQLTSLGLLELCHQGYKGSAERADDDGGAGTRSAIFGHLFQQNNVTSGMFTCAHKVHSAGQILRGTDGKTDRLCCQCGGPELLRAQGDQSTGD